jgi:hypothetical protein
MDGLNWSTSKTDYSTDTTGSRGKMVYSIGSVRGHFNLGMNARWKQPIRNRLVPASLGNEGT